MIVTQAGDENSEESGSEEWKIKRLKWEKTHADQSSLQQLNIARFHGDRKPKTREKICHENCSITSSPCSSFSQQGPSEPDTMKTAMLEAKKN